MPRLILLNGAPGSGKSTLAKIFAQRHPLTLALDIDTVRGLLGAWLEQPHESGLAARKLALAMARVHLQDGHDVLVPQFLGRIDFVLQLEALAQEVGFPFVEVALISTMDDVLARYSRRAKAPETQEHRDAAALLERSGGTDELRPMYERLLTVVAARPATRQVLTVEGEIEQTYQRLLEAIGDVGGK
ncbi:ATP-binding protein [Kineosporia rhizophila]|uniref:AAA family ATPase n=1 Tax=Kineosporia rhizophila TaxID=84633 RepID=UPI001E527EA5|nr:ATP-binding protein [Kineosporia rhizophila]